MPSKRSSSNGTALNGTEWVFGTLEAWRSAPEVHDCVPGHFLDLIADAINEDESLLDVAVDRLAAANKRVHDATGAMDDPKLYSDRPSAPIVKAPGGKYDLEQVRYRLGKVLTTPSLARQAALGVLDQAGGGVKSVSSLKPENFDKVYEACQSLLGSEGASAEAKRNPQVEQSERKVVHSRK
jgi:hypothetical protein